MKTNLHNLAASIRTLLGNVQTHLTDNSKHVSTDERNSWNNKTDDSKIASSTELGHVKVGDNLTIDTDGKLSANIDPLQQQLDTVETSVSDLSTEVDSLFTSVSNGKSAVANAITQKGVTTATDAEFATMAGNIGKILKSTGSAVAADVIKGKTFSNNSGTGLTGSIIDYSGINANASWVSANASASLDVKIPVNGYFSTTSSLRIADINFIAANIVSGKTIFGVAGTAPPGRRFVSGTGTVQNYSILINVNAIGYVPNMLRVDFPEGTKIFYTPYFQYSPYITTSGSTGAFLTTYNSGIININCSYGNGTSFNYYAWE